MPKYDVVIAGAGLAGTTAAFHLSKGSRVLLIEASGVGGGATGVGAGIASPILARKGNPAYEARSALDDLDKLMAEVGFRAEPQRPLIRPALDKRQLRYYERSAVENPDLVEWLSTAESLARYPGVSAPLGSLRLKRGHVINMRNFAIRVAAAAAERGCEIVAPAQLESWEESADDVAVRFSNAGNRREAVRATRLILAMGVGYHTFESLRELNLHPVKGQLIRATCPAALCDLPNVTGPGYLAHDSGDIVLGSTFEHGVVDTKPSGNATREILSKMLPLVTGVRDADYSASAGVRVTVPGTRLPMLGPISAGGRTWIYTGLGSKGLLMSAYLSARLPTYLADPEEIPVRMRPHLATK